MTDTQLYLAIGVPVVVNLTALGMVASLLMHHFDKRLDEMCELCRAERARVEQKLGIR
jgi:hypothetical protein